MKQISTYLLVLLLWHTASAGVVRTIVVAKDGKGDFSSIQLALNSIADSGRTGTVKLLIKKGIYTEKIFIEKSNVILEGDNKEAVVITQSIARDEWRCNNTNDWGVATININGNDITLKNLTIQNSFGFDFKNESIIACPLDSANSEKRLRKDGHQMALRTMAGTRIQAINCHFLAFGGDTVSPWNVDKGLFYFKNCTMEGGVDFYCPRGWAYAEDCRFIAHSGSAAIWHDGSKEKDSKTVLNRCTFEGFDGFKLGRYHRDAQFYLLNCVFADNMADEDIYQVKTNNVVQWGRRVYYFNCHRKSGKDYPWHSNNFNLSADTPDPAAVNAAWVFGSRWKPVTD